MDSLTFPAWKKILYSLKPLYLYILEHSSTFHIELVRLFQDRIWKSSTHLALPLPISTSISKTWEVLHAYTFFNFVFPNVIPIYFTLEPIPSLKKYSLTTVFQSNNNLGNSGIYHISITMEAGTQNRFLSLHHSMRLTYCDPYKNSENTGWMNEHE